MTPDSPPACPSADTLQRPAAGLSFVRRIAIIGAILFAEKLVLSLFVETAQAAPGLAAWARSAHHWGFRFAVTLGASLAVFAWIRGDARLKQINAAARALPLRPSLFVLHFGLVLPLVLLSHLLYGNHAVRLPFIVLAALWLVFAFAAAVALCLAFAPWPLWRDASRGLGMVWTYALCAAGLGAGAMEWSQGLWAPTASATFGLVRLLLAPALPTLRSDPVNLILSTDNFAIQVADNCSGLEGVGLMLAFCTAWLLYCRRELAFPRALLLIPAGLLLIFALNVLRISILMLIGDAGLTDLAVYGFHSQAGWIAFNCAACGIAIVSRRSAWLQHRESRAVAVKRGHLTTAFLLPFLIVLGGGMMVLAAAGSSTPWSVVPALAGGLALWHYRRDFTALDWSFSWRGAAAGCGVFLLWMLAAHWLKPADAQHSILPIAAQPWGTWRLLGRLLGSVVIVPIAEELAYRGYLLRRLVGQDFAAVRFEGIGLWPLLTSTAVFAAAHGTLWPAAAVAGLVYGLIVIRTGRIGEAVLAHATTNTLIALAVVLGGHWELW